MANVFPSKIEYKMQVDNLLLSLFTNISLKDAEDSRLLSAMHTHTQAEIFVCKSGNVEIETTGRTFLLFPGDVAIVPAEMPHIGILGIDAASEWATLKFACSKCSSQNDRNLYKKLYPLANQDNVLIYKNTGTLHEIIKGINTAGEIDKHPSLILDFVSELCKLSDAFINSETNDSKSSAHNNMNFDRLVKLDCIINERFMKPLTNQEIANELHLGERQLSRLVMKHYGATLHTIINKKRVSVAAHLLSKSSDTIENIALSVGFNNKTGFYREFKKAYGVTPAQYKSSMITFAK